MKHIIKKSITLMLAIVVAMGIMSFERKRVDAETKSLAVGTEYYFDDSIDFDGKWITLGYGIGAGTKAVSGVYPFHEITYNAETKWWQIVFSRGPGDFVFLYFHDSSYTGEEKVKGIKCVDGEGTEENPFIFELIIENTPADDPEPDEEIITEVKVNVTPPKEGAKTNKPKVKLPKGVHYHLKEEPDGWYDATYVNFDHDVFQASDVGESAMVIFKLGPDEGYRFADEDSLSIKIEGAGFINTGLDSDGVLMLNPEFKIQVKDPKPDPVTPVPIPRTGVDAADPYALFRNISLLGVCLIGSVLFITKKK